MPLTVAGEVPDLQALNGATTFRDSFRSVAGFYSKPTSDAVLFSGVPFDAVQPTFEEVERLASRLGLEVREIKPEAFARHAFDLPLLIIYRDGTSAALLEERPNGTVAFEYRPVPGPDMLSDATKMLKRAPLTAFSFQPVYSNASEDGISGVAAEVEKQHWLRSTLKPFMRSYVEVALATLFINLLALATPLFAMNIYDRVLPNKAATTLWVLAIGVAGASLFDFTLRTLRASIIDFAGRKADLRLSYMLYEKILNTSLKSTAMSTGEYANRVSQYEFAREFFTSNTISVAIDCVFVFLFIGIIYVITGWVAVIPLIAFVLVVMIGYYAQLRMNRVIATSLNEGSLKQSLLVETIASLETVKLLTAEVPLLRRWSQLSSNASRTGENIKRLSAWTANVTQFIQQVAYVAIIVGGFYEFSAGNITSGAIVAASMLSSRAVAPLSQLALTIARFRQAMLSLRIVDGIMSQEEDRPASASFVNRDVTSGAVAFRQVDFTYPGTDNQVLAGVNIEVRPGEKVGIIGRIGSGKTTMGRMVSGLYSASNGRVLIDGVDIRQYHPAAVRTAIAFVSQNSDLFAGTVKENLLMSAPQATDEEIIEAARNAGVERFVSRHPAGYDMPVGERGSLLSGGQRQSIAIARILLRKPKIIFLDEPSGAMDLASEKELIDRLSTCFPRETTILISTHRYSMLNLVDRLIVLDQGRVMADGPKAKVIEFLKGATANGGAPVPVQE
ncbi:type I secretion system permease/ATPase [Rhizobium sp. PAMB 3182]